MEEIWDRIDEIMEKTRTDAKNNLVTSSSKKMNENSKSVANIIVNITRNGTYIANIPMALMKKIKNYYTIRTKTIMGYDKITVNSYIQNNRLYLPRFGSFLLKNKFKNIKFNNFIRKLNPLPHLEFTGEFRGNQKVCFDEIMKKYASNNGDAGLILNLDAGGGKSFLAMNIIGHLKCRTLIVVHTQGILKQWACILQEYMPKAVIGYCYSDKRSHGDIVIGVINSLVMENIKISGYNDPNDFYASFDFIIFDEVHEYSSVTRRRIYDICQAPYMLGLSATPDEREDKLDKINIWNVGFITNADELDGYSKEDVKFSAHVTRIKYYGPDEYTKPIINEKLEMISVPKMINQLSEDKFRVRMAAGLILEQAKNNMNVFAFADRRSYLEEVQKELYKDKITSEIVMSDEEMKSIRLMGGASSEQIDTARNECNIILSTYQYCSTGVSIPKMNCLVLLTPRKSKGKQIFGRIFRLGSNVDIVRQIIDIVDMKTSLKNMYYKRAEYYKENNFLITDRIIKHNEL